MWRGRRHGTDGVEEGFAARAVGPVVEDEAEEVDVCSWGCGEYSRVVRHLDVWKVERVRKGGLSRGQV